MIYAQPRSAMVVAELFDKQFKIKNNQLITMISNGETKEQYPWTHELQVPIVDNPEDQTKLFNKLEKAFTDNPATNAVIVKGWLKLFQQRYLTDYIFQEMELLCVVTRGRRRS